MRFQRVLKTPPQPFTISNFLLHYHFALSFLIHRNPAIPTITATLHYPSPRTIKNRNSRHRRNHNSSFFIFHFSFFIIFAANPAIPTITANLPSPSPRTIKNRNSRHRRNHNSSFFILHSSFFILRFSKHHPFPSLRPPYQLLPLTF